MGHQSLSFVSLSPMSCLCNDFFNGIIDCLVRRTRYVETHTVGFLSNCFLYNFIYARIEGVDTNRPENIKIGMPLAVKFLHRGEKENLKTYLAFEAL